MFLQNEINEVPFLIEEGKKRKMRIVLNPSPFEMEIMNCDLQKTDWLILNEIEAEQMTREKEPVRILKKLQQICPGAGIVLTLGENGAMCVKNGKEFRQNSFAVQTVDTTAAGDTFTGYFFAEILKDETRIADALRIAAKASSITVSRQGAAESIPIYSELK